MEKKTKWTRVIYLIGIIALIIGVIDPLEGSIVIAVGSILLAMSAYFTKDRYWKHWMVLGAMVIIGVFFLFLLSSLGGLGEGHLSWWWGALILPYPIGWLLSIVLLIMKAFKKQKLPISTSIS